MTFLCTILTSSAKIFIFINEEIIWIFLKFNLKFWRILQKKQKRNMYAQVKEIFIAEIRSFDLNFH